MIRGMRVLFSAPPGSGHIHPMVPLAREFLAVGVEILWATASNMTPSLEQEGFQVAPCGLTQEAGMGEFARRFPEMDLLPRPEWPDFMFPRLFGDVRAEAMLADLVPIAE